MRGLPATLALAAILAVAIGPVAAAPLMIVGNDEKLLWDDNGKPILSRPGKDSVLIVDLATPLEPKIVANLPLKNSVVGPPVNLAIDPTGSLALVADSVNVIDKGGAPYAAKVALERDPSTFSLYRWTSGKGPPMLLSSGTMTRAEVTTREQRPIDLVIPLTKRLTGIGG